MSDAEKHVNKPKHYNAHPSGVECIQIIEHMPHNVGAAMKYLWRCGLKDDETQELGKAVWYILREILLRGGDINELLAYWQEGRYAPVAGKHPGRSPADARFDPAERWTVLIPNGLPEQFGDILREIIVERTKQIVKGFDEKHDDGHDEKGLRYSDIATAAACCIAGVELHHGDDPIFPFEWDKDGLDQFCEGWDRERQLTVGITLAIAELERIRRKKK